MRIRVLAKLVSLFMIAGVLAAGCGSGAGDCSASQCKGTDGVCYSCSSGNTCTLAPTGSCSTPTGGVYCCSGGGGGSGSTTQYCNAGYCYSFIEGICCPSSAPYACHGSCYTYSGGGGCSSYRTQCY
jgi:hypothetical protein